MLSLLITPLACGGDDDAPSTGGTGGTNTGGTGQGGTSQGGATGGGGQAGAPNAGGAAGAADDSSTSGSGHNRTTCDYDDLIGHYDAHGGATCTPGDSCLLDTECTSGAERVFTFTCIEDPDLIQGTSRWELDSRSCENDSESCISKQDLVGETLCLNGTWTQRDTDFELHQPEPCPRSAPAPNDRCEQLDIGAVANACGYPCEDSGWQTLRCTPFAEKDPRYSDTEGQWIAETDCSGLGGAGSN